MEVKQIYELVNTATKEALGSQAIEVAEDLSNLVDVGDAVFNANAFENYVKKLTDHIGKMVFVARVYKGEFPTLMRDAWEYGSICEKVRGQLPDATENSSWNLVNGQSYNEKEFKFTAPSISVKFFNSKTTFEVPISITEMQLKSAFTNVTQMNSFLSMIYVNIENSIKIKNDELVRRTIDNFIGETFYDLDSSGTYTGKSGTRAINLLHLYNSQFLTSLTPAVAIKDKDFLRFASITIKLYIKRLESASVLFNIGKTQKFTPREKQHIVLLSEFAESVNGYLYSDTWHKEEVTLPNYETTNYWQGTGTDYEFASTGSINVKTSANHTVNATGILGVIFDEDALGVCNMNKRVKTQLVNNAEFLNEWHKTDAGYWNDFDENFVVFYIA